MIKTIETKAGTLTILAHFKDVVMNNIRYMAKVKCVCGNVFDTHAYELKRGTHSCGCYRKKMSTERNRSRKRA